MWASVSKDLGGQGTERGSYIWDSNLRGAGEGKGLEGARQISRRDGVLWRGGAEGADVGRDAGVAQAEGGQGYGPRSGASERAGNRGRAGRREA